MTLNDMEKVEPTHSGDDVRKGPSTTAKVIKTIVLVGAWVCIGLNLEITGPTLKDLKLRANVNYEEVSRAVSGRSIGFFIGAAIGGFLVDKLDRYLDIMIAICLDLMGIFSVVAPHSPYLELMWFIFVMQGTFEGIINIAGQKLILELWREKASSPMHALHLGFGIGSFIVPLIANPFLAVPQSIKLSNMTNATDLGILTMTPEVTTIVYIKESNIEWPFLIVGIIAVAESCAFYFFQFFGKSFRNSEIAKSENPSQAKSLKEIIDPTTCANGDRFFGLFVFLFLFLYFFQAVGGERIYGKFIRSYAIDQLNMDGDSASLLNTEFWISFSIGRFLGFILAICIPIRILLLIETSGALIVAIILNIFARNNSLALWILTVPMGIFIAPCFPSGIGWGDFHVTMTGFGITFLLLGGALGGVSYMWIIGHFYDTEGPLTLMYMLAAYGVLLCGFALLLNFISIGKSNRFIENKAEIQTPPEKAVIYAVDKSAVPDSENNVDLPS